MSKSRLEAFTDGIAAILITLLVLNLPVPKTDTWKSLLSYGHNFVIYLIGFITIAIYWNNHHHLFAIVKKVDGHVLWANSLVILFLSFFPFITSWVSEYPFSKAPQIVYGLVILAESIAYWTLGISLIHANGKNSEIGKLFHGYKKLQVTTLMNVIAIIVGFFVPIAVIIIDATALLFWFLPERQIEKNYHKIS